MNKTKFTAMVLLCGALCFCAGCNGGGEEQIEPLPPETEIKTLEAWEEAFGEERLKNFTLKSFWHMTDNVTGEESFKEIEYRRDGEHNVSVQIERQLAGENGDVLSETHELYAMLGENYYVYRRSGSESWERESVTEEAYSAHTVASATGLFGVLGLENMDIGQEMDAFTYESTRGEYTYHNLPLGTGSLIVRFADSFLDTISITGGLWENNAYYAEVEVRISNYGGTVIAVPNA